MNAPLPMPPSSPNPLAELRDIHLPEPISWWPMSLELWGALVLLLAMLLTAGWLLYRQHAKSRYRRHALSELKRHIADYQSHQQQPQLCQQLLVILRRCLLSSGNAVNQQATKLSAAELLQQLNQQLSKPLFSEPLCDQVQQLAYAATATPLSDALLDQLLHGAQFSIRRMS